MFFADNNPSLFNENINNEEIEKWNIKFRRDTYLFFKKELLWRLPLLYILFGALLGVIITGHSRITQFQSLVITVGTCSILFLQFCINKVRKIESIFDLLYLICGVTTIVPFCFLLSCDFSFSNLLILFFLQALCWMLFPWSIQKGLSWSIFLLCSWSIILSMNSFNLLCLVPLMLILLPSAFISRIKYQELMFYQGSIYLTKLCANIQHSINLCIELCRLILLSLDTKTGLLLKSNGKVVSFAGGGIRVKSSDKFVLISKSFFRLIADRNESMGTVSLDHDDLTIKGFLYDCLNFKVKSFHFFIFKNIENSREEEVIFIIPQSYILDLFSFYKLQSAVQALIDMYSISVFTLKSQTISNKTFEDYGYEIASRDDDINSIVHTVNNNAQDIAIHCESLREILQAKKLNESTLSEVINNFSGIEKSLQFMTQSVTDVKLLRELSKLRSSPRIETISIEHLLGELRVYIDMLQLSKSASIKILPLENVMDCSLEVPNEQYFLSILRLILKEFFKKSERNSEVSVRVDKKKECFLLILGMSRIDVLSADTEKTIRQFCELTNIRFSLSYTAEIRTCEVTFELMQREICIKKPCSNSNWILFLDDNTQVIAFYEKIAEALSFNYHSAGTLKEADQLLNIHGKPRLIISDIQLSDGSGFELFVKIRNQYGADVPIVVISGNEENDTIEKAYHLGATKFLKKPLTRKKLFSEIQNILGVHEI